MLTWFSYKNKQKFHISRILMAVLVITSIFSFVQFRTGPAVLSASADPINPVVSWSELTGSLSLGHTQGPPQNGRDYALVHIAIYDALLVAKDDHANPSQKAVVAGAASQVLQYLFPDRISTIKNMETSQLSSIDDATQAQINKGHQIGQTVGKEVVQYAKKDGTQSAWDKIIPTGPCKWTGANPIGATFGQSKTFILSSWDEFPIVPPYTCGSHDDDAEVKLVIKTNKKLTDEQIAIAKKWEPLPSILANAQLNERIERDNLSIYDAARAAAYTNVAAYDSFVSIWHTKYVYWTDRPFQRIDGFTPIIATPNFPAYPSGHSGVAGATSRVLGHIFPADAAQLTAEAEEDALSRLLGGVHWNQDDVHGINLGYEIGDKVVQDMLNPPHPFIHHE